MAEKFVQKYIVFDASTLISMALTCTLDKLKEIKKDTDYEFCIPVDVRHEIIDRAMNIPRFKFEAYRLKELIDDGFLVLREKEEAQIKATTNELLHKLNHMYTIHGKPLELVQRGEMGMLALAKYLGADAVAVDERTTRMMIEDPMGLVDVLSKKFHKKVEINRKILKEVQKTFDGLEVIRSVELIMAAYMKNHIKKSKDLLDAMLTALKFSGCSVTGEEIERYVGGA